MIKQTYTDLNISKEEWHKRAFAGFQMSSNAVVGALPKYATRDFYTPLEIRNYGLSPYWENELGKFQLIAFKGNIALKILAYNPDAFVYHVLERGQHRVVRTDKESIETFCSVKPGTMYCMLFCDWDWHKYPLISSDVLHEMETNDKAENMEYDRFHYSFGHLFDIPILFSRSYVPGWNVPDGMYRYEISGSDDFKPQYISKVAYQNFAGTILSPRSLNFRMVDSESPVTKGNRLLKVKSQDFVTSWRRPEMTLPEYTSKSFALMSDYECALNVAVYKRMYFEFTQKRHAFMQMEKEEILQNAWEYVLAERILKVLSNNTIGADGIEPLSLQQDPLTAFLNECERKHIYNLSDDEILKIMSRY